MRVIIVEVDEDSHRTYDCAKEHERERVFQAHAAEGMKLAMVRFNPDAYTGHDGLFRASCFKYNPKGGTVRVDSDQRAEWAARCDDLVAVVSLLMDPDAGAQPPAEPGRAFFSYELFYDNVSEKDPETLGAARRRLRRLRRKQQFASKAFGASAKRARG